MWFRQVEEYAWKSLNLERVSTTLLFHISIISGKFSTENYTKE